ncbi:MAG: hypothetical protein HY897_12095 [Deltaproteobacteria bacterium]|nr:hypothetical protein [Deltaproteobacteria bacterium]
MNRNSGHGVATASALAAIVWAACGPNPPSFDEGSPSGGGFNLPTSCCCMRDIVMGAAIGGNRCPDGYTEAPADRCPGGANYPNDVCDTDWKDAGAPEDAAADSGADAGGDTGFDAGPGFCCCNGPDVAPPIDADGGPACPDGFNNLTPDLCPGGDNYPNGLCGT